MTEIYKAATSVFAWLGPPADDSDVAMDAIESIGEAAIKAGASDLSQDVLFNLWDPDPAGVLDSIRHPFQGLSQSIAFEFPQVAIKSLSERSYWDRTWIAQEFSVANILVIACGTKRLQFRQLAAVFIFLPIHRALMSKSLFSLTSSELPSPSGDEKVKTLLDFTRTRESGAPYLLTGIRNRYQKRMVMNYHCSLMDFLWSVSPSAQATDPRDRIYGLLGLARDTAELGIKVYYARKVHQVYTDTAWALLRSGWTDILSWCRFPKAQSDLPSWVPDFSVTPSEPIASYKYRAPPWKPIFSASGSSQVKISTGNHLDDPRCLTISGFTVDTIEEVGTPCKAYQNATSVNLLFSEIAYLLDRVQTLPNPVSTDPQFWSEALWRVPCADQQWHEYSRRRAQTGAEAGLWEILGRYGGDLSGYADEVKATSWIRYWVAMKPLRNFRPFLSTKGYIGMAPEFSSPGDMICIIFGAIAPYVLRRLPEKPFELVGETYMHGIMDGEAMDMGLDEEDFCLF